MNFPEFLGSTFCLAFLYSLKGAPKFSGISQHFPGEGLGDPRIAFSGEDEVDMLGSGDIFELEPFAIGPVQFS